MGGAAVCDATAGGWRLISVGHQLRAAARWVRASLLLPAAYALVVAGMVLTGWGIVSWVLTPGFAAAPLAPLSVAPASAAGLALTERDAYVVGGEPKDLLQDREEGRLYVSEFRRGEVAVVDSGRGLVETIPVGGRPGALIPYAEAGTAGEEEGDGEGTTLAVAKRRGGTISLLRYSQSSTFTIPLFLPRSPVLRIGDQCAGSPTHRDGLHQSAAAIHHR